jgi:flavin-dependent dehydrogenase
MSTSTQHDVVILGGGLAGLTLALQLRTRLPELDIVVLERRKHPVPLAAHKVGESSVEIQAHYLAHVLGLEAYLEAKQIKKFGFRFFFSDRAQDITQVTELGASQVLPTQSYQLDRGLLENDLAVLARERGIRYLDGHLVREFTLGSHGAAHRVTAEADGASITLESRWLVDAAGRAGLVKRRLDLAQPNEHTANAVWFRIGTRVDVNDWSDDAEWLARCTPPDRWRSTNHLVGAGYWVWLIPLASGSHSVGIVADPALHPLDELNSFDKAMAWLQVHQPQLHRDLQGKRGLLQDFAFFKRFSYGCKKVYSGADRWALTGEAGLFLDPFYSPGGDFIAMSNTFITELVVQDHADVKVSRLAGLYERIYFRFYEAMLPLYVGQYRMFGNAEVLPMKVLWDYTFYWGVM